MHNIILNFHNLGVWPILSGQFLLGLILENHGEYCILDEHVCLKTLRFCQICLGRNRKVVHHW